MPSDATEKSSNTSAPTSGTPAHTKSKFSFFDIPAPLRVLFDHFPLVTYAANELPQRAPKNRNEHVLHIFTTVEDAAEDRPSFNPGCLKWQTYLKFSKLDFRVVPSSNHASPSGMLPFLQPAETNQATPDTIASNKLKRWLTSQEKTSAIQEPSDLRYEAYTSLLDNRIRKAWLLQLYLSPQNGALMDHLYVSSCSSQPFVRWSIAHQLRSAAEAELVKSSGRNTVSALDLINDAEGAFDALATLLGNDQWFFGQSRPGLFDASLFAYSHLVLDDGLEWNYNPLRESLSKHKNIVQHRKRILQSYF